MKKEKSKAEIRTTHNRVNSLSSVEFLALQEFSRRVNNLTNCGIYLARQSFFKKKYLGYNEIYKELKNHKDYKLVHSQVGQQALKVVGQDMKSFFANLKATKSDGMGRKVKLPYYKEKKGYSNLRFAKQSFKVVIDQLRLSLPSDFKEIFGIQFLYFSIPKHVTKKNLKMVEIIPSHDGKFFSISFIYVAKTQKKPETSANNLLAIDIGVSNLATNLNSVTGEAWILCGRKIKSINQLYNKEKARLQSRLHIHNDGKTWSRRLHLMTVRRNDRIEDILHKAALKIVRYCLAHKIGRIVIGKNKGWKKEVNLGKKNNQMFVQIPHAKLIHYLTYKANALGIEVVEQEESYTSKCDALSNEEIQKHESYKGRRVNRGLFKSSTNQVINADVNGAINILRKHLRGKCNDESLVRGIVAKGLVFRPWKLVLSSRSLVL